MNSAEADLRLAWHAQRRGDRGRRLCLVTLAVASGDAEVDGWLDRFWISLVRNHPQHYFAAYRNREEALRHPQVVRKVLRLRRCFPPMRVRWMLQREAVLAGPYRGLVPKLNLVLEDLIGGERLRIPVKAKATVHTRRNVSKVSQSTTYVISPQSESRASLGSDDESWIDCLATIAALGHLRVEREQDSPRAARSSSRRSA